MTPNQIREYYLNNLPEGYSKRDIKEMPEQYLLEMHDIFSEDLDEIFENAEEIRIYGVPTCSCCGKTMKKVGR